MYRKTQCDTIVRPIMSIIIIWCIYNTVWLLDIYCLVDTFWYSEYIHDIHNSISKHNINKRLGVFKIGIYHCGMVFVHTHIHTHRNIYLMRGKWMKSDYKWC